MLRVMVRKLGGGASGGRPEVMEHSQSVPYDVDTQGLVGEGWLVAGISCVIGLDREFHWERSHIAVPQRSGITPAV